MIKQVVPDCRHKEDYDASTDAASPVLCSVCHSCGLHTECDQGSVYRQRMRPPDGPQTRWPHALSAYAAILTLCMEGVAALRAVLLSCLSKVCGVFPAEEGSMSATCSQRHSKHLCRQNSNTALALPQQLQPSSCLFAFCPHLQFTCVAASGIVKCCIQQQGMASRCDQYHQTVNNLSGETDRSNLPYLAMLHTTFDSA